MAKQRYVKDEAGFLYAADVFKDDDRKPMLSGTMKASEEDIKDFLMAHLGKTEKEAEAIIEKYVEL